MSNKAPKVDAGSWLAFIISLIFILLTVYILVTSLINTVKSNSTKGEVDNTRMISLASENLRPIGTAATSDAPVVAAAPTAARSGKEVYTAVCAACHNTGVAGSPKLDDKAAWEPRVATGLDAMLATAINGKGAMPPRAGQNVGDEELKATILYMTKEAGFDLGGGEPAAKKEAATEPAVAEEKPAAEPVEEEKKEITAPATPDAPKEPALAAATTEENAPVVAEEKAPVASAGGDGAALYIAKGCGACHGADGKSPIMPLYPKVAGQSKVYATTQMTDIKTGKRSNGQSIVMKGIMAGVSDAEIASIADYLSTL